MEEETKEEMSSKDGESGISKIQSGIRLLQQVIDIRFVVLCEPCCAWRPTSSALAETTLVTPFSGGVFTVPKATKDSRQAGWGSKTHRP